MPPTESPRPMTELEGIPVAGGSRIGRALLYSETEEVFDPQAPTTADVEYEVGRLRRAAELAREDLLALKESLSHQAGIAAIFNAHEVMLLDCLPRIERTLRAEGLVAERAVASVMHDLAQRLASRGEATLASRSQDIVDLERRLLRALSGYRPKAPTARESEGPVVLVARELTPSETAGLEGSPVAAIALELGGATSHTAVIAKSLGIPCVVGVENLTALVRPGDMVWVDGSRGTVVLEPDAATVERAVGLGERYERLEAGLLRESHLPAETRDGHRAVLLANVEFPLDVEAGMRRGAAGVGLFRTEFLYSATKGLPDEEAQVEIYRRTLARMKGGPLVIRTFDFGADKESPVDTNLAAEPNPALGIRSLRWCFRHPEVFRTQLRALLRVAAEGDLQIMFPMVSGVTELRSARAALAEAAASLEADGLEHRADPPVGIMIEIPAAAHIADLLAREADFFSIGTNDLIQYDLAVDRMNANVAPLFRPSHPSVLRLLQNTIDAANRARIPVSMCGEMGGLSIYTVLLFGMGLRTFSLTPGYIPRARRLLRTLTLKQARAVARECLRLPTAQEVEQLLTARVTPIGSG